MSELHFEKFILPIYSFNKYLLIAYYTAVRVRLQKWRKHVVQTTYTQLLGDWQANLLFILSRLKQVSKQYVSYNLIKNLKDVYINPCIKCWRDTQNTKWWEQGHGRKGWKLFRFYLYTLYLLVLFGFIPCIYSWSNFIIFNVHYLQ